MTIRAISVVIGLLVWLVLSTAQIDAQTQAVMNAQARAEFERADAELNTTYQSVLAKLPTVESKQKLREAQRAWVVSRDAEAAQAAKEADGGSMAPTLRYGRMTRLTQERINELNNMVDHGTQNAGKLAASSATASPSSTPESTSEQAQSVSETGRSSSSSASSVSPDKKWEYIDGDTSKLVKAGSDEVVLEFSEGCDLGTLDEHSEILWAPDSKRLAFYSCGAGKEHNTLLYQLRGDHWITLQAPRDELFQRVGNIVQAQAKKKGLPKKTFLHMQWWTLKPKQWLDASTLVVYASMAERVHRQNGEDVGLGFGTDLLVTLKFDDGGHWKIVNTHRMSEKEVEREQ